MCKKVYNSAARPHISMKFGTKVLNWTLNDPGNLYYKQTPGNEINKHFRRGAVFFAHPVYIYICKLFIIFNPGFLQPRAVKNNNNM